MDIQTHTYKLIILEHNLDTFGHVNNAEYLRLYEQARWDMITKGQWGMDKIVKEKVGPVITNINISFLREIHLREEIIIETRFDGFVNPKICRLEQKMITSNGKVKNLMKMEAGLFDLKERKLLIPNDEWMASIGVTGNWKEYLK